MKIKFTEDIKLAVVDYSWGEEYTKQIKSGDVKEVLAVQDNTHGYKDIYFAHKEVAESVHSSAFVVL
jgi:elongation factor P hydroxylase